MIRKRLSHWFFGALIVSAYFLSAPEKERVQPGFSVPYAEDNSAPEEDAGPGLAIGQPWQWRYASDGKTALVHAASMIELPDGRIRAFWFAGSREGGADVGIHSALFDPEQGRWSQEKRVLDRNDVIRGTGRFVRKLGNAVPVLHPDGRLELYVVSATLGGWATSSLNLARSADGGESFSVTRWLVTSPFLNLSTLVKAPAIRYQDGSVGLPAYHELAGKFGEMIRLDEDGHIVELQRMGQGRKAIQPVVLIQDDGSATAFLRNEDEKNQGFVWQLDTQTTGRPWNPLSESPLPNPGSAVGALALTDRHWLLAGNCNPDERDDLCIQQTLDSGQSWEPVLWVHDQARWRKSVLMMEDFDQQVLQTNAITRNPLPEAELLTLLHGNKCRAPYCRFQYDYPYLLQASNGDLHLLYTWNKSVIRHGWLPASDLKVGGQGNSGSLSDRGVSGVQTEMDNGEQP